MGSDLIQYISFGVCASSITDAFSVTAAAKDEFQLLFIANFG